MGSHPRPQADDVTGLLRPATESDLNQIVGIERSCFADPWSEDAFRRLLAGLPAIFQVLVLPPENRLVGYVIAFAVGDDAELLNVAVEPESRGKGFAGQMLDAVLIELGARGVRAAFLEVRESNRAARGLYESRGFREIGRRKNYYRRPVEDALVMRRIVEVAEDGEKNEAGSFADR